MCLIKRHVQFCGVYCEEAANHRVLSVTAREVFLIGTSDPSYYVFAIAEHKTGSLEALRLEMRV